MTTAVTGLGIHFQYNECKEQNIKLYVLCKQNTWEKVVMKCTEVLPVVISGQCEYKEYYSSFLLS